MKILTLFGRLCIIGETEAYCFEQIDVPENAVITKVELNIRTNDKIFKIDTSPTIDITYSKWGYR